jgi:hypothetical protein
VVRVSWVDAGVTKLRVDVCPVVKFVAAPTGANVRICKRGFSGDDKPDSTAVVRVRWDTKAAGHVRRD